LTISKAQAQEESLRLGAWSGSLFGCALHAAIMRSQRLKKC
jgi:hypothetical protein